MSIAKKIVHKGQCIEVISEKSQGGDPYYKYRIKYFPKKLKGSCAWRMLQCQTEFSNIDKAIEDAEARVNTEFENDNWVEPTQEMFKGCECEE